MRLSAGEDAFYLACAKNGGAPRILLNDIEQDNVVIVDTDEGWVERYVVDKNGEFVCADREPAREPKTERINGHVTIIWPNVDYFAAIRAVALPAGAAPASAT